MGTWGEAERVVQPTGLVSGRFSCFEEKHGDREEDERGSREHSEGFLGHEVPDIPVGTDHQRHRGDRSGRRGDP
jgi:hypothetical protein